MGLVRASEHAHVSSRAEARRSRRDRTHGFGRAGRVLGVLGGPRGHGLLNMEEKFPRHEGAHCRAAWVQCRTGWEQ